MNVGNQTVLRKSFPGSPTQGHGAEQSAGGGRPPTYIRDLADLIRLGSIQNILEATGVAEVMKNQTERKVYEQYGG